MPEPQRGTSGLVGQNDDAVYFLVPGRPTNLSNIRTMPYYAGSRWGGIYLDIFTIRLSVPYSFSLCLKDGPIYICRLLYYP